ncbi:Hypothetical protein BHO_0004600 (plasmid) [Borrelia hermsii YBT]|uniref:BTA121 domain-containing protein surface lipoprotein n=1 Tax=Borrelia hermsii TaxID=140 RepID=UPI0003E375C4|nr:hypothetical protein [Borrelia hermsii]AHH12915.1 Hypothetical protein BHO_0004600 [Borrelia hermsii YBT]
MMKTRYSNNLLLALILLLLLTIGCDLGFGKKDDPKLSVADIKLNQLLNTFRLQDDEREVVMYMRNVAMDPSVDFDQDYRTYNSNEFYSLVYGLGSFKTKMIIGVHFRTLKTQKEAKETLAIVREGKGKRELADRFRLRVRAYNLALKNAFSDYHVQNIYDNLMGYNREFEGYFIGIIDDAKGVIEVGDLYIELFENEKLVVNHMVNIVTNPKIGRGHGYKTYMNKLEFYGLLSKLGIARVRELIRLRFNNVRTKNETLRAINRVKDKQARQDLLSQLNILEDGYPSRLKLVFSGRTPDMIYNQAMNSLDYVASFMAIKNEADAKSKP